MIPLYSQKNIVLNPPEDKNPFIGVITTNPNLPDVLKKDKILLDDGSFNAATATGFRYILTRNSAAPVSNSAVTVKLADELGYLKAEDIIKINPSSNAIRVMYRFMANTNSFLVTERCNSYCLMCSQPPRNVNDGYLVNEILQALPMINKSTPEIGITGGEPTLLGDRLFELVRAIKSHLPVTALHILTNGRNFKDMNLALNLAKIKHHDLMLGIPLYSDISEMHDFVVQADGAYDETIRGILNLKRCQQRVEIRVVIHKQTYARLPQLAEFISRNLLFVDQVVLMGLEMTGFTKANLEELWIDPHDYKKELAEAVNILARNKINVRVYNHQLCLLPESIHKYAVKSISDWKNDFMPECEGCVQIDNCGGFFSSAKLKYSSNIKAFKSN